MLNIRKLFHVFVYISRLRGQNFVKNVLDGVKVSYFEILIAEGPGKFCSSRTTGLKVGVVDHIFRTKRQLHEANRIWAALPGAERREGVQHPRIRHTWLVETENNEAPVSSDIL